MFVGLQDASGEEEQALAETLPIQQHKKDKVRGCRGGKRAQVSQKCLSRECRYSNLCKFAVSNDK